MFPLHSPNIRIEVIRHGDVRRAKLYYLRERTGKSARIAERSRHKLHTKGLLGAAAPESAPVSEVQASEAAE